VYQLSTKAATITQLKKVNGGTWKIGNQKNGKTSTKLLRTPNGSKSKIGNLNYIIEESGKEKRERVNSIRGDGKGV